MTRLALIHAVRAGRVSYEHLRQQGLQGWAPCGAARGRKSFQKRLASRSGHRTNRSEDFAPLFLPSDETHRAIGATMKVLMVLTSHDQLGNTGRKTGFWLEELAAPYYVFKDSG